MRKFGLAGSFGLTPALARRMADVRAVLMRGLSAKRGGKGARQVGQVFLLPATQRWKHLRQKLCWQGACGRGGEAEQNSISNSGR